MYTRLKKQALRKSYFEKNYEAGASLTTAFPSRSLGTSCGHLLVQSCMPAGSLAGRLNHTFKNVSVQATRPRQNEHQAGERSSRAGKPGPTGGIVNCRARSPSEPHDKGCSRNSPYSLNHELLNLGKIYLFIIYAIKILLQTSFWQYL